MSRRLPDVKRCSSRFADVGNGGLALPDDTYKPRSLPIAARKFGCRPRAFLSGTGNGRSTDLSSAGDGSGHRAFRGSAGRGADDPRGRNIVGLGQRLNAGVSILGQDYRGMDGLPEGGRGFGRGHLEMSGAPSLCQVGESCTAFLWRNLRCGAFLIFRPATPRSRPDIVRQLCSPKSGTSRISADSKRRAGQRRVRTLYAGFRGERLGKIDAFTGLEEEKSAERSMQPNFRGRGVESVNLLSIMRRYRDSPARHLIRKLPWGQSFYAPPSRNVAPHSELPHETSFREAVRNWTP
jgi:hypothetical protein